MITEKTCPYLMYNGNPCGRELYNNEHCIFHSENIEEKKETFNNIFIKEFERQKNEEKIIDFTGFKFPDSIQIMKQKIEKRIFFNEAIFFNDVEFLNFTFTEEAQFINVIFNGYCSFKFSIFKDKSDFFKAIFKKEAHFECVHFKKNAYFNGSNFNEKAHFLKANFSGPTGFIKKGDGACKLVFIYFPFFIRTFSFLHNLMVNPHFSPAIYCNGKYTHVYPVE